MINSGEINGKVLPLIPSLTSLALEMSSTAGSYYSYHALILLSSNGPSYFLPLVAISGLVVAFSPKSARFLQLYGPIFRELSHIYSDIIAIMASFETLSITLDPAQL